MAVIHGGYSKVEIANNASFGSTAPDWSIELTNLKQGTTYEAEPLEDDMADGMPAPAGIRYNFTILSTDFTAAQYTDIIAAKEDHGLVFVRFHHKKSGQHVTIKSARIISTTPMLEQVGAYGHRIIQGVGFGPKSSDVADVEDGAA